MGRAARTAATAAAPELRVISGKPVRKIVPDMSPDEVNAELKQRAADAQSAKEQRAAAKARRAAAPGHPMVPAAAPAAASPAPTSPGAGPSLPTVNLPAPVQSAASTGSGFLLGVFAWAVGLAYLQHGSDGVKKLLRAKFLNQTS